MWGLGSFVKIGSTARHPLQLSIADSADSTWIPMKNLFLPSASAMGAIVNMFQNGSEFFL